MRRRNPDDLINTSARNPVDATALVDAAAIVEDIRSGGEGALRRHARRLDGHDPNEKLVYTGEDLETAYDEVPEDTIRLLERTASRIAAFARAQRNLLSDLDVEVSGGRAGHKWMPVASVGAYAPGGRHPLVSTVLMTVVPARIAGVETIWAASPRASDVTLAAAHIAGADGVLSIGGVQAIAAMAFGTVSPRCDLIVGPGNKWVTAAKKYLFGEIGIDGLAGPSEILVIADDSSEPSLVASDLLAQAEHDPDARPILVALSVDFLDRVEDELERQLTDLPTAKTARESIARGTAVVVDDLESAAAIGNALAPEHLALHTHDPTDLAQSLLNYGAIFLGPESVEAYADYGIGPNHVLPTGGSARFQSGLSVSTFLRSPTWLQLDDSPPVVDDIVALARLEGLEGHARAALARRRTTDS